MTTVVITIDQQIQQAIAEFNEPEHIIQQMTEEFTAMTLDTHPVSQITESRKRVKKLRLRIEERRKELKEDSLKYGRAIDSRAKELVSLITPIESHLEQQEEIHEQEKARQKSEKEAAKRARVNQRIAVLTDIGAPVDVSQIESMTDEDFSKLVADETVKVAERNAKIEAERIERERAEEDRKAELARQQEELRAERQKIEQERAEIRRQQDLIESERRQREAEESRKLAEENQKKIDLENQQKAEALKPVIDQYDTSSLRISEFAKSILTLPDQGAWGEILLMRIQKTIELTRIEVAGTDWR